MYCGGAEDTVRWFGLLNLSHTTIALLNHSSIGALNHKFFCLFLLYTALSCIVSLLLLVMRMVHCGYYTADDNDNVSSSTTTTTSTTNDNNNGNIDTTTGENNRILSSSHQNYLYDECNDLYSNHWVTLLAICSLVFLIFTSAMGCEQLEAIETGQGKIARMKQSVGASGSTEFNTVTTEFNEMFGGDSPHPAWHWYLPIAVPFPRGMKQVVLGYEFNAAAERGGRPGVAYQEAAAAAVDSNSEHKEEDSLLHNAEAGQASPPSSPESDKSIAGAANADSSSKVSPVDVATATTTDVRRSLYTGRPVDSLPLSRRSNSRTRSSSSSCNTTNHDDDGGITLVERTKARLA